MYSQFMMHGQKNIKFTFHLHFNGEMAHKIILFLSHSPNFNLIRNKCFIFSNNSNNMGNFAM